MHLLSYSEMSWVILLSTEEGMAGFSLLTATAIITATGIMEENGTHPQDIS